VLVAFLMLSDSRVMVGSFETLESDESGYAGVQGLKKLHSYLTAKTLSSLCIFYYTMSQFLENVNFA